MPALDFPTNPSIGDVYTANGRSFRWDGVAWIGGSLSFGTQWVFAVPVDGSTYVLPSAVTASERTYVVKAFAYTVTVTATAGLIEGTTSAIITPPNSATFHSDGTNWYII
jgi:hypothetical protein